MSKFRVIDDLDIEQGHDRKPTDEQIIAIRDQLRAKRKIGSQTGVRPTFREMEERGFKVSRATVARVLGEERDRKACETGTNTEAMLGSKLLPTIVRLLKPTNSSTSLAILENRTRMALNIILAQRMAASPDLLLEDMRATAALIDALTAASKQSNDTVIDIHVPTREDIANAGSSDGLAQDMVDITPPSKSALALDIENWRKRRSSNGQGTQG